MTEFPTTDNPLTHIMIVSDFDRARDWYRDVLGADLYREYGGSSAVFSFSGTWILLTTAGGPTEDKPDVHMAPPDDLNRVSHAMTIRVQDCQAVYDLLKGRGADFLTPPVNHGGYELRCFFRDPDGHLFEISQVENVPPA